MIFNQYELYTNYRKNNHFYGFYWEITIFPVTKRLFTTI